MAWKVDSVVERPSRPASNFIVGTQRPKSRLLLVDATKPPKFPVTALVTAPAPTAGELQMRVLPLPVQAPEAAELVVPVEDAAEAEDATETDVATEVAA